MLVLNLFGTGQGRYGDTLLSRFPNKQPWLLFCFLVLNRRKLHPREHVAALFWGEDSTRTSLKRLRCTLWRLRSMLQECGVPPDDYLLVQDDSMGFVPASPYYLDVELFEVTILRYQDVLGRELMPEQAVRLEKAVDLRIDDLLASTYEDWCLIDREQMNLLYLSALSKLVSFHETHGSFERALAYGERILTMDDTREAIHRKLMRLHWLSGDRNGSLVQYRRCAQILRETLNVSPMRETTELYQQILADRYSLGKAPRELQVRPTQRGADETTQLLVEQALRSLQSVEATLSEVSAEVRRLAKALNDIQEQRNDAETLTHRRAGDAL